MSFLVAGIKVSNLAWYSAYWPTGRALVEQGLKRAALQMARRVPSDGVCNI